MTRLTGSSTESVLERRETRRGRTAQQQLKKRGVVKYEGGLWRLT